MRLVKQKVLCVVGALLNTVRSARGAGLGKTPREYQPLSL